ncbi:MAG: dihydrodipicolinate synthase family protein [Bacteroidota bacterium]|nr:dihydrodipicolinate synthase family protein [Bacteroidota bacterium]
MMDSQPEFRLPGLTPAAFTPMHVDGQLNLDAIGDVVDFLVTEGVSALFVLGSTGEGLSLITQERHQVAKAFVEASAGRLPVVVHVGHSSLEEACRLARHAQYIGADAISAVAPFYFKPETPELLAACLARIAGGAPELPFYYYHIPAFTGVDTDLPLLARLCSDQLPTFTGIKFSDTRLQACFAVRSQTPPPDVLFGVDEMLLSAWAVGIRGAVGTTYNFAAPLYRRMIACYQQGDLDTARTLQAHAAAAIEVILRTCGRTGFKALMGVLGVDCGPSRLPLGSSRNIRQMTSALESIGFFEWGRAS